MKLRFYLDPATGEPHIYKHGIIESEVEDVILPFESLSQNTEHDLVGSALPRGKKLGNGCWLDIRAI